MFLKFLDDQSWSGREGQDEAGVPLPLKAPYRWRDWAAKEDGVSGDALKHFINYDEAIRPDGSRGPGLLAYRLGLKEQRRQPPRSDRLGFCRSDEPHGKRLPSSRRDWPRSSYRL